LEEEKGFIKNNNTHFIEDRAGVTGANFAGASQPAAPPWE